MTEVARRVDINIVELYRRSFTAARSAVVGAPSTSFGLDDIVDDWGLLVALFAHPETGQVAVDGVLAGSVDALRDRACDHYIDVGALTRGFDGTFVMRPDVVLARDWIERVLREDLDAVTQQTMTALELGEGADGRQRCALAQALPVVASGALGFW